MTEQRFTHLDETGAARMVDVSGKEASKRVATAQSTLMMQPSTATAIRDQVVAKGDVLAVARIAGIQAAKKTSDVIPLCHPVTLSAVSVDFTIGTDSLVITATAETTGPTGVEMEALTAASVAALTVYDMCKALDRGMTVAETKLITKSGGRSGDWKRN